MNLAIIISLFCLGLVLIIKCGDWFVDAACWLAEATGIPKFIVGATIVSLATTLPELLVSLSATIAGKNDLAIGNAVGSVIANIGLVGAISLIFLPSIAKKKEMAIKGGMMIFGVIILGIFSITGKLNLFGSVILFSILLMYIYQNIQSVKHGNASDNPRLPIKANVLANKLLLFVVAAIGIVLGSQLLVDNGSALASLLGISERIIGVTVVAIGTSLPELVTTVAALTKKEAGLSIGNIIGANIIDLTLIVPICSLVSSQLVISQQTILIDMPIIVLLGSLMIVPAVIFGRFKKWQGFSIMAFYIGYLIFLII